MPDVLLLDIEIFRRLCRDGLSLADLHHAGPIKVVVCGHHVDAHYRLHAKRDGVFGTLDLETPTSKQADGPASLLRRALDVPLLTAPEPSTPPRPPSPAAATTKRTTLAPSGVVIGSSTGGPMALMTVLKALPSDFPLPIAVVQHMPPGFTRMLAERLNAECAMRVVEAESGMKFEPGTVYIAPGGVHMALNGSATSPGLTLNTQPPENSCRPAVDVLFRSSALVYGARQHAIVLTGMGRDGLIGATQLYGLGARIVVQDAATSTVWGMPGAIAQAGFADDILPIHQISTHLLRCL